VARDPDWKAVRRVEHEEPNMRRRIGLSIGANAVHAVWAERGKVRWKAAAAVEGVDGWTGGPADRQQTAIGGAIERLFEGAPRAVAHARVRAVFSPAWVQVKALPGLPKLKTPRLRTLALRENQQAFFLWRGGPSLIADVHTTGDGSVWGAAFYSIGVEEVNRATRQRRMPLVWMAPSVVALSALSGAGTASWTDGFDVFGLESARDGLRGIRRIAGDESVEPLPLPQCLASLGDEGPAFLAAYAAAVAPRRLPLMLRPQTHAARVRLRARVVKISTAAVVGAAATFAAVGPAVRAERYVSVHQSQLMRAAAIQVQLKRDQAELKRVTQSLDRVTAFNAERGNVSRLLASLTQAIPESTAVLTFHVDSAEGVFTAIAPHVSDVLPELTDVEGIFATRIVGSVTRETISGARVERAGFRFRRRRMAARPRVAK
jgi:hypothetical protein